MNISDKKSRIFLAIVIVLSLALSTAFMMNKQGYHEDELLTYNLANSANILKTDGEWNSGEELIDYLSVSDNDRFNYAQVYENQIIDASHPPFYYGLVHTVCSFFPNQFSRYFAFSINVLAMAGILIMLFKIVKKIPKNNLNALKAAGAFAFSIACTTMTIYLRMYAPLTFFVLAMIYMNLKIYESKNNARLSDFLILGLITLLGTLTQYYFILFEGLTALIMLVFKIKEKKIKDLIKYIVTLALGSAAALCVYPYIITNVIGGNRGFGSLSISVDPITVVTYFVYKICTYIQVLAKDVFLNQIWLLALCGAALIGFWVYLRFVRKEKLSRTAFMAFVPSLVYFVAISLVSPFNSDRYIMASLPMLVAMLVLALIKFTRVTGKKWLTTAVTICLALTCAVGYITVKPYYMYGVKTELYTPQTERCVFVGTAMLEWNKSIDKLANYKETMIVQTPDFSPTLADELEDFAEKRGVITNGKITEFMIG